MSFLDWVEKSADRFRRESPGFAVKRSWQELLEGALRRAPDRAGESIWSREWDVLVILDACRYDVFADRYENASWLDSLDSTMSVGSASPEWMDKTFTSEYSDELASTAYVTGNPYSAEHAPENELGLLDEVWQYVWDDELGTIHPEPLTNQVVTHYKSGEFDRVIVHYMQPHWPYVTDPLMYGFDPEHITGDGRTENAFDRQNRGEISRDEHMKRYEANLEYIVDHVRDVLLRAIDADTVALTADHATLFGEYGLYKHPTRVPLAKLRQVPWAVTTAQDHGEYTPDSLNEKRDELDKERQDQLRDLGYVA